jgi:hypothetical protein
MALERGMIRSDCHDNIFSRQHILTTIGLGTFSHDFVCLVPVLTAYTLRIVVAPPSLLRVSTQRIAIEDQTWYAALLACVFNCSMAGIICAYCYDHQRLLARTNTGEISNRPTLYTFVEISSGRRASSQEAMLDGDAADRASTAAMLSVLLCLKACQTDVDSRNVMLSPPIPYFARSKRTVSLDASMYAHAYRDVTANV